MLPVFHHVGNATLGGAVWMRRAVDAVSCYGICLPSCCRDGIIKISDKTSATLAVIAKSPFKRQHILYIFAFVAWRFLRRLRYMFMYKDSFKYCAGPSSFLNVFIDSLLSDLSAKNALRSRELFMYAHFGTFPRQLRQNMECFAGRSERSI